MGFAVDRGSTGLCKKLREAVWYSGEELASCGVLALLISSFIILKPLLSFLHL